MIDTIETIAGTASWKIPFKIEPSVMLVAGAKSDFIFFIVLPNLAVRFLGFEEETEKLEYLTDLNRIILTDTTGKFVFGIPIIEGVRDLVIQPEKVIRNNTIKMESSFSEVVYPFEGSGFSDREIPAYVPDMSAHYQVAKIYGTSYTGNIPGKPLIHRETKRFYGKPDIELVMDDYIKIPVMQEVFFELLPGVLMIMIAAINFA